MTDGRSVAEEPQQNHAQGHPQDASDDARLVVNGIGHSLDQGIEPRSGQPAKTDADLCRKGAVRGARTHSRTTLREGVSGLDRHANGTRPVDLLSPTGTMLPNEICDEVRFCRLQRGHQENHTEHRVAREKIARSRSTRSNRGRAQVRTSTAHDHGTRATSVSGMSAEDVKIMVAAFLAERGVQANRKAHIQRMAIAHAQRPM